MKHFVGPPPGGAAGEGASALLPPPQCLPWAAVAKIRGAEPRLGLPGPAAPAPPSLVTDLVCRSPARPVQLD